ncbi:methylmalonyl-CoA mutase family protein [Roseibium sediminis]|uniref:methylmalonyl-CoA mutase family protein n=1 Tax=Roseibium sediminis TaxID=1775174 RepID=UPI00123E0005|nr:methylmalonyl-CoA mutase family protein [Roseibium sediminis]
MTDCPFVTIPDSFLEAREEDWWTAVDAALKGADRSRLTGRSEDGFSIEPIYKRRGDAAPQAGRGAGVPWTIVQRVDLPSVRDANAQILEDLNGGAGGLELVFASSTISDGNGIRVNTVADLGQLLDGVLLDLVTLRIAAGHEWAPMLAMFAAHLSKTGLDPKTVSLNAGWDPLGWNAQRGEYWFDREMVSARICDAVAALDEIGCRAHVLEPDGRTWHNAGASQAEELACVMAAAIEYLRLLEAGLPNHTAPQNRIGFTLTADADQIGTIAKARAARRLWAAILDGCGLDQTPMRLHMQSSYRMLTTNDPWVNLLRNTVAAFSAGIGGADTVAVLPFTGSIGLPDSFARRLSRNTQSILIEESNLHMVADPSAGSGAIEARTEQLVEAAWSMLQDIEKEGGLFKALTKGIVQNRIAATAAARGEKIARRLRPITGVSEFPDLFEKPVSVLENKALDVQLSAARRELPKPSDGSFLKAKIAAYLDGADICELITIGGPGSAPAGTMERIHAQREAVPFEILREQAELAKLKTGQLPGIFLACLGSLSEFTARATWTRNAFAAGGIEARGGDVVASLDDLVAAFKASGARMACIVSSDRVYADQAEAAAKALKAAGASHLYLAGKPGELEAALTGAGVDTYLYAGGNLLSLLGEAHERLGIAKTAEDNVVKLEAKS